MYPYAYAAVMCMCMYITGIWENNLSDVAKIKTVSLLKNASANTTVYCMDLFHNLSFLRLF